MVDAEVAGVLFTANPVTGRRRQAVIDASPGLGEAVVSGAVNPDHFVVDTATGRILQRRLGDKRVRSGSAPSRAAPARRSARRQPEPPCLNRMPAAQPRLTSAAGSSEHFGAPQDIEWAFDATGRCG